MRAGQGSLTAMDAPRLSAGAFEIRPLQSAADLAACVELQREIWGQDFDDVVPPTILKIAQRLGGVVAGAFAASGELLGFVFGMTGVERGAIVHWSDMLGVRSAWRDRGIGRALKAYQRHRAADIGVTRIYWTFDPLQARNAHLNINVLGAHVVEYVVDMYGESSSLLHRGVGTDRFVVAWDVGRDATIASALAGTDAPVLNADAPDGPVTVSIASTSRPARVRVQIPLDVGAIQDASAERAARWRTNTRHALRGAMEQGYVVTGFVRDDAHGRGYYQLSVPATSRV